MKIHYEIMYQERAGAKLQADTGPILQSIAVVVMIVLQVARWKRFETLDQEDRTETSTLTRNIVLWLGIRDHAEDVVSIHAASWHYSFQ